MLLTSRPPFGALRALIALTGLLVAGCATQTVPVVDMNKADVTKTRRIALLKIAEPKNFAVANVGGGTTFLFGVVGAVVQADANSSHTSDFVAEFNRQKRSLAQSLTTAFSRALTEDGYEVAVVDQKPKPSPDGKTDDYSEVHVDADAIASVWFTVVNYSSPPNTYHYEPTVVIRVRIMDAATKQELYFKTFSVGRPVRVENAVILPADPDASFRSFDDMIKHFDVAVAGLTSCGDTVAKYVATDLRKRAGSADSTGARKAIVHHPDFKATGTPVGEVHVHEGWEPAQIRDAIVATFRDRGWDITEKADDHMVGHIKLRSYEAVLTVVYDTDLLRLYCEGWKIDKKTGEHLKPLLPDSWIDNIRKDLTKRLKQAEPDS